MISNNACVTDQQKACLSSYWWNDRKQPSLHTDGPLHHRPLVKSPRLWSVHCSLVLVILPQRSCWSVCTCTGAQHPGTLRAKSGNARIATPSGGNLEAAQPDDLALFLHTSGTTSKPKGVPLSHRNLAASLTNIVATYDLSPSDRSLLVMPLFHVHGLMAGDLPVCVPFRSLRCDARSCGAAAKSAFWTFEFLQNHDCNFNNNQPPVLI